MSRMKWADAATLFCLVVSISCGSTGTDPSDQAGPGPETSQTPRTNDCWKTQDSDCFAPIPLPDTEDAPTPSDLSQDPGPWTPDPVSPPDTPDVPAPLFDHDMIRNAATAACSFTDHHTTLKDGVLVDAWKVTYYSWEVIDGELHPILIRGFAARPSLATGKIPGLIQAHGLGGFSEESHATGAAALLGTFVIAYTGPGGGTEPSNTSEGLPASAENGYKMFDTLTDLRGSWFWGHAVAAMRGLTCLETRDDVDKGRLGITGFSAGGVISHIVAGVDDRAKAAVPLSGTLAWSVAVQSPDAWQHELLEKAGLTVLSPEWVKLMELVDPQLILAGTKAGFFQVNGSSDEFFPLTAHMATYNAIPADGRRISLVANFDHGCYKLTGGESPSVIEARADLRAKGAQRAWFRHRFEMDANYAYIPQPPVVTVTPLGAVAMVTAAVDGGGNKLAVEEVKVWVSNDQAFFFGGMELKNQGGTLYGELVPVPIDANSVYFVDVQYKTGNVLFPERFSVSSPPVVPPGQIPHIRNIETCM